ncbi:hypothetical protein ElyMa_003250700 [Elysia marginata]|uniref:Uncharacterized protein n=1 Tax=Elysia marginata TaxID=1093978 RepID=A0AAV4JAC0_9GAST|nr:hypothetical protein ElyMa_003250700 [Elysia marginata]
MKKKKSLENPRSTSTSSERSQRKLKPRDISYGPIHSGVGEIELSIFGNLVSVNGLFPARLLHIFLFSTSLCKLTYGHSPQTVQPLRLRASTGSGYNVQPPVVNPGPSAHLTPNL